MTDALLWPPLDEVRRALGVAGEPDRCDVSISPPHHAHQEHGVPPCTEPAEAPVTLKALVERRVAASRLPRVTHWSSGDIVAIPSDHGLSLGVVLDEPEGGLDTAKARVWRGWLTAAEVDWASADDLILEPDDEPFDPVAGVVQTWNRVRVTEAETNLLGRLSAARLAAVRAVQDEAAGAAQAAYRSDDVQPGVIALRGIGSFTVLTGAPLGAGDCRDAYRAIYRALGMRLSAAVAVTPVASEQAERSFLSRIRHWVSQQRGIGVPARVGLAGACVLVLAVSMQALHDEPRSSSTAGDEIRFRSISPLQQSAELNVRWRDTADAAAVAELLRGIGGEVVGGPNAAGRWQVRVPDVALAQRAMLSSPLVAEVQVP